jgi:hypothetical protein
MGWELCVESINHIENNPSIGQVFFRGVEHLSYGHQ